MPFNPVTGAYEEGSPTDDLHLSTVPLNTLKVAALPIAAPIKAIGAALTADPSKLQQQTGSGGFAAVGPDGKLIDPNTGAPVGQEPVYDNSVSDEAPPAPADPYPASTKPTGPADPNAPVPGSGVLLEPGGMAFNKASGTFYPRSNEQAAQQLASVSGGGGPAFHRITGTDPQNYGQTPTEQMWHGQVYNHMLNQRDFSVAEAANQAQLASQQADVQAQAAAQYSQMLEEQRRREAERQMWVQTALDKHEQMANELSAQQIDPDRFFTSKGVAGGIMAGIGMAMSGVADAVLMASGAPGAARFMDRAMGMIDRDIAVQKANIQLKRDAFGAQMGVYAERYKAFGDERVAEASARASIFDWLAVQMKAYQAQAFERTTAMAVGQIAEDLSFRADAYKNGITIASEHAYDEAVAKQQAAYWNAVAAARKDALDWQKYQRKTLWDNNMEIAKHAGMENGGLIGQMPSGHPLAGMPNMIMQDAQGNIVNQLPGNPVVGTGGMNPGNVFGLPPGVKPGSKDADKWEARTVGARINGQEVNIVARSEGHAMKLAPALSEAENYINALKQMKTALKDIHSLDGWKLYEGAFNNAGGGYKQIYNLGAYDLGVQNLVAGSLPSQSLAFVRPEAAAKMIDQQLHNAELIRQTAIASWARHGTVGQIAQATGGSDYSSLGAVKVDDPTTPGSWLGAAAGARFMGGPGAIAGYYLGK